MQQAWSACKQSLVHEPSLVHSSHERAVLYTLQLAVALHSDPVARQHLTCYHTDCHKKAWHDAFVLLLSPIVLFPSLSVLLLLPFALLLSRFLLLLSPFHKLVC